MDAGAGIVPLILGARRDRLRRQHRHGQRKGYVPRPVYIGLPYRLNDDGTSKHVGEPANSSFRLWGNGGHVEFGFQADPRARDPS